MYTRTEVGLVSNAVMILRRSLATGLLLHNFPFCKGLFVNIDQGSWALQHTHSESMAWDVSWWSAGKHTHTHTERDPGDVWRLAAPVESRGPGSSWAPDGPSSWELWNDRWVVTVGVRWPGRAAVFLSLRHTHTWHLHSSHNAFNITEHIIQSSSTLSEAPMSWMLNPYVLCY